MNRWDKDGDGTERSVLDAEMTTFQGPDDLIIRLCMKYTVGSLVR